MYENPRRNRQARKKKKTNKQKQKKTYTQVECMHLALFIFFLLSHRKYHKPTANYILSTADNPEPVR